jgi:Zn finger protein HypA/HybF involved in hydrogenase expression
MLRKILTCRDCGWRTVSGRDDLVARLHLLGWLRRDKDPDDSMVEALIAESSPRMTCPMCKGIGLVAKDGDDEVAEEDFDDWQAAILCEICRQAIDPERLEFLPETKRCAACQNLAEQGKLDDDEPEFCPRCGSLVEIRVSRGSGITRYRRFCTGDPPCRLS